MKDKNKYGQYFTIESISQFMVGLIHHDKGAKVLEPSCGEGIFLKSLLAEGFTNLSAYEIDETLGNNYPFVEYRSFISAPITPFDVVIGNPPYIRWKNLESNLKDELNSSPLWNRYFNSLCDYLFIFILKSIEHLTENGELIFICTEYWLNTTHSQSLRDYMARNGFFAEIYHFKEAPLFEGVCASFIVFRYIKHRNKAETISLYKYNQTGAPSYEALATKSCFDMEIIPRFKEGERWLLATAEQQKRLSSFEEKCSSYAFDLFSVPQMHRIGDVCDIGNGMVSGLDKAFNVSSIPLTDDEEQQCIRVIKAKDLDRYQSKSESKYFFIRERVSNEEFEERFPNVCQHMRPYVEGLKERYDYGKAPNL